MQKDPSFLPAIKLNDINSASELLTLVLLELKLSFLFVPFRYIRDECDELARYVLKNPLVYLRVLGCPAQSLELAAASGAVFLLVRRLRLEVDAKYATTYF